MLARMIEADDPPVDELENQDMERHSQGDKWRAPQPVLAPSGLRETRPLTLELSNWILRSPLAVCECARHRERKGAGAAGVVREREQTQYQSRRAATIIMLFERRLPMNCLISRSNRRLPSH